MPDIKDILNTGNLAKHIDEGYISVREHPDIPIRIYNYTQEAMFDQIWDNETMICRGLIVDTWGHVVARPFRKFFNINTESHPETMEANLPTSLPVVTEKMDGSLGVCWSYGPNCGVATRGSFTSDQAQWATKFVHEHYPDLIRAIPVNFTLLVEIIYPENIIVVDYDFSDVVILGMVDNIRGLETTREYVEYWYNMYMLSHLQASPRLVAKFDKTLSQAIVENIPNKEGYIYTWSNLKIKVKFEDYLRLHKLITGVSPKSLWKALSEGSDPSTITSQKLPESFINWVNDWSSLFKAEYGIIRDESEKVFRSIVPDGHTLSRKDIAAEFIKHKKLKSILFLMLDDRKELHVQIWKVVWDNLKDKVKEGDTFRKDVDA